MLHKQLGVVCDLYLLQLQTLAPGACSPYDSDPKSLVQISAHQNSKRPPTLSRTYEGSDFMHGERADAAEARLTLRDLHPSQGISCSAPVVHLENCKNYILHVFYMSCVSTLAVFPVCTLMHRFLPYPLTQVAGCDADLRHDKVYCQSRRVCSTHMKVSVMLRSADCTLAQSPG